MLHKWCLSRVGKQGGQVYRMLEAPQGQKIWGRVPPQCVVHGRGVDRDRLILLHNQLTAASKDMKLEGGCDMVRPFCCTKPPLPRLQLALAEKAPHVFTLTVPLRGGYRSQEH
jgi:hypothetical protein